MADSVTKDTLAEIENFAYVYLKKDEISIITGVDVHDLSDNQCEAGKAFLRGRLKRKAELNGEIIKLSKQLSSPAMAIEFKIAEQTYLNDLKQ